MRLLPLFLALVPLLLLCQLCAAENSIDPQPIETKKEEIMRKLRELGSENFRDARNLEKGSSRPVKPASHLSTEESRTWMEYKDSPDTTGVNEIFFKVIKKGEGRKIKEGFRIKNEVKGILPFINESNSIEHRHIH